MGALDHFLNGLDAVLKASDRAKQAKAAERAARQRAAEGKLTRQTSFGGAPPAPIDPSCCLAKRRVK